MNYHGCHDCIFYGWCDNKNAKPDYYCDRWDWRYEGSWFDK